MPAYAAPLSLPFASDTGDAMSLARAKLEDVFGYKGFRPLQGDIIDTVLRGGDCLALMPTGGGKSLCYQIPSLVRRGTGIVVSPLIALMQDQVDALKDLGVKAAFLNSTQDRSTQDQIERQFADTEKIPVPPHWGGWRIRPEEVEFWQGRRDRMHDRLRFRLGRDGWQVERVAP